MSVEGWSDEMNQRDTCEVPISLNVPDTIDQQSSAITGEKINDVHHLEKGFDYDNDKSQRTLSSSALNSGEGDENDDLLSDYTSETTFFDAERTVSAVGKSRVNCNHIVYFLIYLLIFFNPDQSIDFYHISLQLTLLIYSVCQLMADLGNRQSLYNSSMKPHTKTCGEQVLPLRQTSGNSNSIDLMDEYIYLVNG